MAAGSTSLSTARQSESCSVQLAFFLSVAVAFVVDCLFVQCYTVLFENLWPSGGKFREHYKLFCSETNFFYFTVTGVQVLLKAG